MDAQRKKELVNEWKMRKVEMAVVYMKCKSSNDLFLGMSKDTRAWFNRHNFQLSSNMHRNKYLQELWNKYGADDFEHGVFQVLKQEEETKDYSKDLEVLFEICMSENPNSQKL